MAAEGGPDQLGRLRAAATFAIMDTPREAAFDSFVFTAAQLFRVPMAMIALAGHDRIWLKASVGPLPRESAFDDTICAVALRTGETVVVEDASADSRFANLPMVTHHPGVRFYAGIPLHGPQNIPVGTLAVLDLRPHGIQERTLQQLKQLAVEAEDLLSSRIPTNEFGG